MLQSRPSTKHWAFLGAMEEIYINVEYDKSVDSTPSQNQTGKNYLSDKEAGRLSFIIIIIIVSLTVLSVLRSEELREEISWSCCSLSWGAECFPAGWAHQPLCLPP